jgi:hypothetical protein
VLGCAGSVILSVVGGSRGGQIVALTLFTPTATEGQSFNGVVATGTASGVGTLSAGIDWGDGQTSSGTVTVAADGSYSVTGSHTYAEEGSFALTVRVTGSGSEMPPTSDSGSAKVTDATLSASTPTPVIKGLSVTLTTTFTDADPNGTATDYTTSINWGDGTTSAGTIGSSGTSFTATRTHKYGKHGTYTVTVTIKDAGGSSVTTTVTIMV